jgi:hypothetical protein
MVESQRCCRSNLKGNNHGYFYSAPIRLTRFWESIYRNLLAILPRWGDMWEASSYRYSEECYTKSFCIILSRARGQWMKSAYHGLLVVNGPRTEVHQGICEWIEGSKFRLEVRANKDRILAT